MIFFVVRRRRRQRMHTTPTGIPSFNASHPLTVPLNWNRTPAQPTPYGYPHATSAHGSHYVTSPVHSTTSLTPTSHALPGITLTRHSTAPPIADAANMITPFLATSPVRQTNRSNTSPPLGKADEALSEHVMASGGQRARLNPPSYSASVVPESSGPANTWSRRLSMKKHKRQQGSASGTTMYSGHSRTSTRETVTTGYDGPPTVRSADSVDGGVEITHSRRAGISDQRHQRPPAV